MSLSFNSVHLVLLGSFIRLVLWSFKCLREMPSVILMRLCSPRCPSKASVLSCVPRFRCGSGRSLPRGREGHGPNGSSGFWRWSNHSLHHHLLFSNPGHALKPTLHHTTDPRRDQTRTGFVESRNATDSGSTNSGGRPLVFPLGYCHRLKE